MPTKLVLCTSCGQSVELGVEIHQCVEATFEDDEPCPQCKDFKDKHILYDGHDERCIFSVRAQPLMHDREKDD